MNIKTILLATLAALSVATSANATEANPKGFKSQQNQVSYALGYEMGESLRMQSVEVNPEWLSRGIQSGLQKKLSYLTQDELDATLTNFREQQIAKQEAKIKQIANNYAKQSSEFLKKNKAKKGMQTTASGLQYRVIQKGKGRKPRASDKVTVDYEGRLISGEVFDSSYKRGTPATFKLNHVIAGWTEALQMMSEGATWELVIPPNLAYGADGIGGVIGPNETLLFKVHLISIQ